MRSAPENQDTPRDYAVLSAAELCALLLEKDRLLDQGAERLAEASDLLEVHRKHLEDKDQLLREREKHIRLLEEYLRLAKVQRFGASSEKLAFQSDLFDEAELEATLGEYEQELAEDELVRPRPKKRARGFSETLPRVQIRLALSEEEKAGASKTFFTKV